MIDHLRKFVVDKHLEAASHKRNTERRWKAANSQSSDELQNSGSSRESSYLSQVDQSVYRL